MGKRVTKKATRHQSTSGISWTSGGWLKKRPVRVKQTDLVATGEKGRRPAYNLGNAAISTAESHRSGRKEGVYAPGFVSATKERKMGMGRKNLTKPEHWEKNRKGRFIIYGDNAVKSVLRNRARKIYKVICTEQTAEGVGDLFQGIEDKIIISTEAEIMNILAPEGITKKYTIIAYVGSLIEKQQPDWFLNGANKRSGAERAAQNVRELEKSGDRTNEQNEAIFSLVMLDEVTDPRNVGAVIRSARAFGINGVIMPKRNSPEINATVVRASVGYSEEVSIYYVSNLANTIRQLRKAGFVMLGFDSNGEELLSRETFKRNEKKFCLIFGSEGEGMSRLVKELCDGIVTIPMQPNVDSLNIASAASIVFHTLYEFERNAAKQAKIPVKSTKS